MAAARFSYPDSLRGLLNDRLKKGEFMKSIAMPIPTAIRTVQLSEEIKKQLLQEVKETLATDINVKQKKRFTASDLWKLQRNSRSAGYLMYR